MHPFSPTPLSPLAQEAFTCATAHALARRASEIDSADLLIGLTKVSAAMLAVLVSHNVTPEKLTARPNSDDEPINKGRQAGSGHIAFTAELREILANSRRIAAGHGASVTGVKDLVAALFAEPKSAARSMLEGAGQTSADLRTIADALIAYADR